MGYFPSLIPSDGGAGFYGTGVLSSNQSPTTSDFSGTLQTFTVPSDAKFLKFVFRRSFASTSGNDRLGLSYGEGVIDLSTGKFSYCMSGARQNYSTGESHVAANEVQLVGSLPYTFVSFPTFSLTVSAYSGPGNTFTMTATALGTTTLGCNSGYLQLLTTYFRRT